jgi:hypothetical protein
MPKIKTPADLRKIKESAAIRIQARNPSGTPIVSGRVVDGRAPRDPLIGRAD